MKLLFSTALAAVAAQLAAAHCKSSLQSGVVLGLHLLFIPSKDTFPYLYVNNTLTGEWQYVRMTDNHYSNGPVRGLASIKDLN